MRPGLCLCPPPSCCGRGNPPKGPGMQQHSTDASCGLDHVKDLEGRERQGSEVTLKLLCSKRCPTCLILSATL